MDYNNKYLKYKSKYLNLKNLLRGGGKYTQIIKMVCQELTKKNKISDLILNNFLVKQDFKIEDYEEDLTKLKTVLKKETIISNSRTKKDITFEDYLRLQNENISEDILNFFEIKQVKRCTIEELMTLTNFKEECSLLTDVTGSCGDPTFIGTNSDITEVYKNQWIDLLNLIDLKLDGLKYIDFVIGATEKNYSAFTDKEKILTLCICPIASYEKFDVVITDIKSKDSLLDKIYKIEFEFPLSHNFPNSKIVLKKIIDLHKKVPVRITNRMCGTCFRSMYYLVQNGISYIVDPEQGLDKNLDTTEIRKCFK